MTPGTQLRGRLGISLPTLSVCLGLATVATVGARAYLHLSSLEETERSITHTHEVIEAVEELFIALEDAVVSRRGFALSGDPAQLGPYRRALDRVNKLRSTLRQLTGDNPAQQRRLDELDPLLTARLAQLESNLHPSNDPGRDGMRETQVTAEGNAQSERIRRLLGEMAAEERGLLVTRQEAARADSASVKRTLVVGFGVSLAILLLAFLLLRREVRRRTRSEALLAEREHHLAITMNSIADGVIATDATGMLVYLNPVAESLTGWTQSDAAGRPFGEVFPIVHEETRLTQPDPVAQVLSSGAQVGLANHTLLVARDGAEHPIADSAAPILDAEGRVQGVVIVFRDVTDTRASEARFRRLLEAAPDAILIVDQDGRITDANAQVATLFGHAAEALVGQRIEVLIPDPLRRKHEEHRTAYDAAPTVRAMGQGLALFARRKDGSEFPVEVSLSPYQWADSKLVIAAVRDISRRHELERFRDEYMEFISHDLKNPLSVIALQARVLQRRLAGRELTEEARSVAVIAQCAASIDRLVRELLEMAYVESEKLELDRQRIALGPFLEAILDRTISTSDRPRVDLIVQEAATALVEPRRIERVVVNFLDNALKYSPPGAPIVVRLEAAEGMATVSVADQGPGLSAEEASFVFDKYRRTSGASRKEGLGLGLYIGRKIVQAHGGRIGVESAPGKGARFFFQVPLAGQPLASVPVSSTLAVPGTSRVNGLHVLLVDDEVNAISALTSLLRDEGVDVSAATTGEEAVALARTRRPDVAVLDVQMPGMGGLELLAHLRTLHPGLPVVIMSGHRVQHPGITGARETTGATYLGKPVDVDELLRTLERIAVS